MKKKQRFMKVLFHKKNLKYNLTSYNLYQIKVFGNKSMFYMNYQQIFNTKLNLSIGHQNKVQNVHLLKLL